MKRLVLIVLLCLVCVMAFSQSNVSASASYDMKRKNVEIPLQPITHIVTEQVREQVNTSIIAKQKEWTDHIQVSEHADTIRTTFVQTEVEKPDVKTIILFDKAKDVVRPEFKQVLDVFIPNYIKLLQQHHVKAICLRGFASTEGGYEYNMGLSLDRAKAVLAYSLNQLNEADKVWFQKIVSVHGFGATLPIILQDGTEDRVHSRRVEIDVILEE